MSTRAQVQIKAGSKQAFSTAPTGLLQRKCACGGGASSLADECAECSKAKLGLQTKLRINEPGDEYEQEADRVAEQVMATPAHPDVSSAPPRIQRFTGQPSASAGTVPASVDRVLASPGRPLEPALKQDMQQRFSHDFSGVRVHSGAAAEQSAREVQARAYTVGSQIVFAQGEYLPHSLSGRRLLAHELAHTIQQGASLAGVDASTTSDEARGHSPRVISRKPFRGVEHVPSFEPEPTISVLRFTYSDLPLTMERLVAWALWQYKEGVRVEELFARLQSSHEFTGSEDDRANAQMALALELQKKTLDQRVGTEQRARRLHKLAREHSEREEAIKHYNEFGPKLRPRRSELLTLEEAYAAQAEGKSSTPTRTNAGNAYWNGMTVARYTVVVPPGAERGGDGFRHAGIFQVDGFFYYRADGRVMDDLFYGATALADIAWENTKHINVLYGKVMKLTGIVVGFAFKGIGGDIAGEAFQTVGEGMENEVYASDRRRHGIDEPKKDLLMPSPPPRRGMSIPGAKPKQSTTMVDPVTSARPVQTPSPTAPAKIRVTDPSSATSTQRGGGQVLDSTPARGTKHDIEVTTRGIELCSPQPCPLLNVVYKRELDQNQSLKPVVADLTKRRQADPENPELRRQSAALEEGLGELKARNALLDAIPEKALKARAKAALDIGGALNRQEIDALAKWMGNTKSPEGRQRNVQTIEEAVLRDASSIGRKKDVLAEFAESKGAQSRREPGLRRDDPTWSKRAAKVEDNAQYGRMNEAYLRTALGRKLATVYDNVADQVRIQPNLATGKPATFYFIADHLAKTRQTSGFVAIDGKLSASATLTPNQHAGYSLLSQYGGTVKSRNAGNYPYGTVLPPTPAVRAEPTIDLKTTPRPQGTDIDFNITPIP